MSSVELIDISPLISTDIDVWPGDVPFSREQTCAFSDGDNLDLSAMHTTLHLGAHADAPSHYLPDAAGIGARALDFYYGPCEVVEVAVAPGARIGLADVGGSVNAPRVLFKTGSFPDPNNWNNDFASLSPELINHLVSWSQAGRHRYSLHRSFRFEVAGVASGGSRARPGGAGRVVPAACSGGCLHPVRFPAQAGRSRRRSSARSIDFN